MKRGLLPARRLRPPRRGSFAPLAAFAALVGLSLLGSACGGSPRGRLAQLGSAAGADTNPARSNPSTTSSAASGAATGPLAFSRCMRAHGVPSFPDPDSQGNFPALNQQALGVSKQTSLAAQRTYASLLSSGGSAATPQQRQQKLAFGLKVAECLRTHGYANFPDPTASRQSLPPGVDLNSPGFQSAETACETQARKALGVG